MSPPDSPPPTTHAALPPQALQQALQQAFAAYNAGELDQAEQLCGRALGIQAQHFEAFTLLGVIAARTGRAPAAAEWLGRAVAAKNDEPTAHMNYGNILARLKRLDEALQSYDRALELKPDFFEACNNRATILKDLGRLHEALDGYDCALKVKSDDAELHFNRANALHGLRRLHEALASYDRALTLKPDFAEAYHNRGNLLLELGLPAEALHSYDRALHFKPNYFEAHNNRANVLESLERFAEALESYECALRLKPDFAAAYYNRGNALRERGYLDEAVANYDRALSIKSDYAEAYGNRGNALHEQHRLDEARDSYARALAINPDLPWLQGNWLHEEMRLCEWNDLDSRIADLTARIREKKPAATPFPVLTLVDHAQLQLASARIWVSASHRPHAVLQPLARRPRSERIRLGYYSADFHAHATAYLIAGLIERHDRSDFEVVAFSFGAVSNDEMRKRLATAFDRFIDVHTKSDREIARLSRELGIDIATDLKGYTQNARSGIFSHRAAPIQVSYLGYPGTMGAPHIDYLIADATLIPPDSRPHYTEKIVYLPHSYQVNDRQRPISERAFSREELGLPPKGFVFCCFNNSYKITPAIFDIWMRLLRQVNGSVLWLLEGNATAVKNLRSQAQSHGIDAQRLVFAPRLPLPEHLARHHAADLFLDTLPCNAHTTASDALWAGLPVLTQMGESFAARVAGSLLTAIGLPELIASTGQEYEARALQLAREPVQLAALKQRLERNRLTQPLFDTPSYTRYLEDAYRHMYERYQSNLGPEDLRVAALQGSPPAS
jgi:predicted O-linked N-acetylglucosamine transferase (SPINDLY family)